MQNQVPHPLYPQAQRAWRGRCGSTSDVLFGLGVVLLVLGGSILGDHRWNLVGLGLIVFSSLVELD